LSGVGEDADAGEVVWLAEGISGVAVAAGFSMLGPALALEACSGARGALKERKYQVSKQRMKYVGNNAKKGTYPEATGLGFFGWGAPTFCLFCC
jgi:hypothetical protein